MSEAERTLWLSVIWITVAALAYFVGVYRGWMLGWHEGRNSEGTIRDLIEIRKKQVMQSNERN